MPSVGCHGLCPCCMPVDAARLDIGKTCAALAVCVGKQGVGQQEHRQSPSDTEQIIVARPQLLGVLGELGGESPPRAHARLSMAPNQWSTCPSSCVLGALCAVVVHFPLPVGTSASRTEAKNPSLARRVCVKSRASKQAHASPRCFSSASTPCTMRPT
jgi:hypothetical protein